jgi:hypothetical protein
MGQHACAGLCQHVCVSTRTIERNIELDGVFVWFKPEAVACTCIHLTSRKQQLRMPPDWWPR